MKDEILSAKAFEFKPELLRQLAPDYWFDTSRDFFSGMGDYQYPVLQRALAIQRMVLSRFLDGDVLRSLQEIALQADPGQDVLQLPEVFDALTDSIWTEVPAAKPGVKADQKVEIHTMRRNLQREHVRSLARLVLGPRRDAILSIEILLYGGGEGPVPPDARSLARQHLHDIDSRIQIALANAKLDAPSRAHLAELHEQIEKVFKALVQMNEP